MARQLVLIKHPRVIVEEGVPRVQWHLSPEGREQCASLAEALAPFSPSVLYASPEIKTIEAAECIAAPPSNLPITIVEGLQENDRRGLPFLSPLLFRQRMALFYKERDERVMGLESADEALERFSLAIKKIIALQPEGNIVVISHSNVISLFIAAHNDVDPFRFWQHFSAPALVVLTLPDFSLLNSHEFVSVQSCQMTNV